MIIEATADGRKVMIETDRIQYIANNDGKADVKGDDFILRLDDYEEVRRQAMKEHYNTIEMLEKAQDEIEKWIRALNDAAETNSRVYEGVSRFKCMGECDACATIMQTVRRVFRELKEQE